ncbi:uncharacterized protein TNCV_325581 [Trichonephila clavipes]|nr:uncharacterized protein TNCV_325581 [Trichonephila clavipes]
MHKEEKCFVKERKKKNQQQVQSKKVTRKEQKKKKKKRERISSTKKILQNTLLMLDLKDGNANESLLMIAQINTDIVNHPVLLTTEPSTSLVRVGTEACKSIINSILRYKDYDSHKNAHKDFQKRFVDNRLIDTGVQFMIDYGLEMI